MNLQYIRDIKPSSRNWNVKVIVCDKTQTREQKVTVTTYGFDINTIGDKLELYKTYIISNASVTQQQSKYNIYNYPFQRILKYFTKVQFQRHDKIDPSILNYRFASLQGLGKNIDKRILTDVLAIVIDKRGQRHIEIYEEQMLKKEYIIMNEEGATVLLTLWNNIATSEGPLIDDSNEILPIIRATSLAISPFQGGSLGSTSSTIIALNPKIPEATNLRKRNLLHLMNGTFKLSMYQPTRNSHHTRQLKIVPIKKVITERHVLNRLNKGRMESRYTLKDIQFLGNTDYTNVFPFDNKLPTQGWMTRQGIIHEEQNQWGNEFVNIGTLNLPDTLY
ncbi:hypothetical protein ACJIZ3_019902 [Penstemon smallii]|uniref:Uncharacterized protein n=1 Tax=Penstemon smallii TaxID=265156 RepID=A0ABD3T3G1_9LAMI